MSKKEIVRRALHQVYGNITQAERDALDAANKACWAQQANGNAGSQLKAHDAMRDIITDIVDNMPEWRTTLIADYITNS